MHEHVVELLCQSLMISEASMIVMSGICADITPPPTHPPTQQIHPIHPIFTLLPSNPPFLPPLQLDHDCDLSSHFNLRQ